MFDENMNGIGYEFGCYGKDIVGKSSGYNYNLSGGW